MATSTTNALSISTSSAFLDAKATPRQPPSVSPQCVSLPTLLPPPVQSHSRFSKTAAYCRKIARNVMVMTTTGEAPASTAPDVAPASTAPDVAPAAPTATALDDAPAIPASTAVDEVPAEPEPKSEPEPEPEPVTSVTAETPETDPSDILKTIQEAWNKAEDKYAVSSLAVAGFVGLWGSAGMISAIDRLPLVPGVLELVGIGYSGWFAYKNLITKTDRDAFILKVKNTYKDIIGSS